MRINELIEIDITDNGMNFEGIARLNDKVVFVPYGIKGERVKARMVKENLIRFHQKNNAFYWKINKEIEE